MQIGEEKKSSASGSGDNCLYVLQLADGVQLHESDSPGVAVFVPQPKWEAFLTGAKAGEFD